VASLEIVAKPLSPLHQAFGRAVRQLRDEQGLSQEALGQKTGLHRNYVGGVERGELNPSLASISKLARGLDQESSALLALAEDLLPVRRR
jgi:transcriptional regulator with XRE-family HTH domain